MFEFTDEWESKKLGEIANISSGGTPSRANLLYWNGNIPWVSTSLIDFNTINDTEEKITKKGLTNSSAKIFPKGSLLMAMYGQGKTRGKVAMLGIEATTNQACASIVTNNEILNSLFLFQNLSKRYDEIRDLSNQGGQQNLSETIIKGIEIRFPSLPEQEKIASFLSLIDQRIQTQIKIIEELKLLKTVVSKKIFSRQLRFKDDKGKEFPNWETKKLEEICEKKSSNISANKIEDNFGEYVIYGASGIRSRIFISKIYKSEDYGIPCIEEQTKIADFLSALDNKIATEISLLQQLENQKKYLLQNLFI